MMWVRVVVLLSALAGTAGAESSFQGIGELPGGDDKSFLNAVSASGEVAVGHSHGADGFVPIRWTASEGLVEFTTRPASAHSSSARAVSDDAQTIVGFNTRTNGYTAFRWTAAGGMVELGYLPVGDMSIATDVSADGERVVGWSSGFSHDRIAVLWSDAVGIFNMGVLPGADISSASAISADGFTIVGYSGPNADIQAMMFTAATGMVGLGDIPGGDFSSRATDVSADGSVVVGYGTKQSDDPSLDPSDAWAFQEAFRWTSAEGMVGLGHAPDESWESEARAVSADGNVVIGVSHDHTSSPDRTFIWDPVNGMRDLETVLVDYGVDVDGWSLAYPTDVSADGTTIVGYGFNPDGDWEGWVAVLDGPVQLPVFGPWALAAFATLLAAMGIGSLRRR